MKKFLIVLLSLTLCVTVCFCACGQDKEDSAGDYTFTYKNEILTLRFKDYDGNFSYSLDKISFLTAKSALSSDMKDLTTKEEKTGFLNCLFDNERNALIFETVESGDEQSESVKSVSDIITKSSRVHVVAEKKAILTFYLVENLNEIYIVKFKSEQDYVVYYAKTPDLTEIFTTYVYPH